MTIQDGSTRRREKSERPLEGKAFISLAFSEGERSCQVEGPTAGNHAGSSPRNKRSAGHKERYEIADNDTGRPSEISEDIAYLCLGNQKEVLVKDVLSDRKPVQDFKHIICRDVHK